MLLSWLRHTSFFTHHLRVLSSAVAWGVGEAISRAARERKGDLARPLSDWMPQSYLLTGDGRGEPEADEGAGVFAA